MTKHAVSPQIQYIDKVIAAMLVVIQRQVPLPSLTQMTKRDEIPQTQYTDKGYCRAYSDTTTGPSASNCAEDGGSPADAVHRQPDSPGDQARRDSADTIHRQGYCRAYYDTATGPSASNCAEDGGSPADAVHRQPDPPGGHARRDSADTIHRQGYCRRACCDTATGPSDTDGFKDCESPEPVLPFQEEIDETIKLFPVERIPERNGDLIVDVSVPQTLVELAEMMKAENKTLLNRIFQ